MRVSFKLIENTQDSYSANLATAEDRAQVIDLVGSRLGAIDETIDFSDRYKGARVVKVVNCVKHPNANKLQLCKIDDGGKADNVPRDQDGLIQVVCGAPNVSAGLLVVWLAPGLVVPATTGTNKDPLVLEAREIRGELSQGMLASASELGFNDDHSGLLIIEDNVAIGSEFVELYNLRDFIIDIENKMFTHRPDCFGHLGIARELAGISAAPFKSPEWYREDPGALRVGDKKLKLEVSNEILDLVPRFCAVAIADINVEASPLWIQTFLMRLNIRPINNVVDLTNLYMVITGQPLHAYDYDKIKNLDKSDKVTLVVRHPHTGEKLKLLSGKEVKPESQMIMISGLNSAIGLGGVMGGEDSEVDDQTKNIILECATFDMYSTRRTSMSLGVFSEAVSRYTKGQSPRQNLAIITKVAEVITEHCGGSVASDIIDKKATDFKQGIVKTTKGYINERLGSNYDIDQIVKTLTNVEFEVSVSGDELSIKAPFWRTDIDAAEDIVEEVGRLQGFDNIPLVLPKRVIKPVERNTLLDFKHRVANELSKLGANQSLTYSFVHGDLLDKLGQDKNQAFRLVNALSPGLQYYRLNLLPSLLEKVHPNIKSGYLNLALFEINPVHNKNLVDTDNLPIEFEHLAFVFAADNKIAKSSYSGASYYQAKHYLSTLLSDLGIDFIISPVVDLSSAPKDFQQTVASFEPSRLALVSSADGTVLGYIGEIKSMIHRSLKLPEFVAGFELDITKLQASQISRSIYKKLSKYPGLQQDICFKVNNSISYQSLVDLASEEFSKVNDGAVLADIAPVDIYQRNDDSEHKQITLRLHVINYTRTMTDVEVSRILDGLAGVAKDKFNAERI